MRKFIQPVAMPVNKEQYLSIVPELYALGYAAHQPDDQFVDEYYFLSNTWADLKNKFFIVQERTNKKPENPHRFYNNAIFIDYNPELFLALAAMSEGPKFYPGEWVVCEDDREVDIVKKGGAYKIKDVIDGIDNPHLILDIPQTNMLLADRFRKATKGELIDYFTEKAVPNPEFAERDLQEQAEHFASTMKLSKALDDWEPKRWMWVEVRNSEHDNWKRLRFLFKTGSSFVCISEHEEDRYLREEEFRASYWRFMRRIIPKTKISMADAKNKLGEIHGVPAEQIEIVP